MDPKHAEIRICVSQNRKTQVNLRIGTSEFSKLGLSKRDCLHLGPCTKAEVVEEEIIEENHEERSNSSEITENSKKEPPPEVLKSLRQRQNSFKTTKRFFEVRS